MSFHVAIHRAIVRTLCVGHGSSRSSVRQWCFEKADVDDVVPPGCVAALEALVYTCMLLAGELLRDHREVPHEMAGRRLVALHAVFRAGRWVLISGHEPRLHRVALRTVIAEAIEVRILPIMASRAVQDLARGARIELVSTSNVEPRLQ